MSIEITNDLAARSRTKDFSWHWYSCKEGLLNTGSLVLVKRLNRLDDKQFETLATLKVNKHYG